MKQNNDFQWSIQIPTFLSHEKCDEILETIKKSEQNTIGCVGDVDDDGNPLENQIIPNVRKTTEYYLLPQKDNEFRPDQPNNDWNWLLDKISMMVNMVNDKIYHFDIETNDGELKMIEYEKGGHYTWQCGL